MTLPENPAERMARVRAALAAESAKMADLAARTDRNGRVFPSAEALAASLTTVTPPAVEVTQ